MKQNSDIKNILLLFPTQLFQDIGYIKKYNIEKVIIYEEPKFFTKYRYHKLKLLYHRITCKKYKEFLESNVGAVAGADAGADAGVVSVMYCDFNEKLPALKITHMIDPIDHELEEKYKKKYSKLDIIPSQFFTLTRDDIKENAAVFYKNKKFSHLNFYKWQRRRLDILMKKNGEPLGDRWSYDTENRKKMPADTKIPTIEVAAISAPKNENKKLLVAAKLYINKHFAGNYGDMNMIYPTDFKQARAWLKKFVKEKLATFGKYQDASVKNEAFLFHSVLTPMLNIGLLTDFDVIDAVDAVAHKKNVPIASLEGFLRQILGWRNYVYAVYVLRPDIQDMNFFNNKKKLSDKWWHQIGVDPIDDIIQNKIIKYAYAHHIERLMYLGSYMLMSQIDPKEVYRYFMEWSIDAYEWVMVPNIFGMSQYADGGIMMKRPYFSSSNYILKMSNYKRGEWCAVWDAAYYEFLKKNKAFFKNNYFYANSLKYI